MSNETTEKLQWFALRVTYRRELQVKNYLDDRGIENYLPMHWTEKPYAGKMRKVFVPLIHNLIFVRIAGEELKQLKAYTTLPICYIMNRAANAPAVIPERQMNDFMAVVAAAEQVEVVEPCMVDLQRGETVRVTEGPFKGIEGRCIRSKGRSRVAVSLDDIAVALTAYIPIKHLERI